MDYAGGKPARPLQSNGHGTPGMQQSRAAGAHMTPSPSMPYGAAQQPQPQLSGGVRRVPPQATMTPRVFNVQRFPGGPVNQRRILVPVTQTPPSHQQQQLQQMPNLQQQQQQQHFRPMQQQQPREGETPPHSSSPLNGPPPAKQQLMQPVHLQLPQSATAAAGMVRRPMPVQGTPHSRQLQPGMTPQMHAQQQHQLLQRKLSQQRNAGAASAGRPQQQHSAAGTPQHPRSASAARTHGGATSAARVSAAGGQSQPPRYNRQQMQMILRTTASAIEKVRQLRSTVRASFLGGMPVPSIKEEEDVKPADAAALQSEAQQKKMQAAKSILDSLVDSLRFLPNSTVPMYGGREMDFADLLDNEQRGRESTGETVGTGIERTLMGEDLRAAFYAAALECMAKQPTGRSLGVQGGQLKEGLNAHSAFVLCLSKMQTNKRLQQQRNLNIRLLNSGPRDTRFEMCISTPHNIHPTTTVMRVVITVCDGCLARATFLGPNELVDSLTEERSSYLVYRQMSISATEALLSTAKGRQMSLMSSLTSIFAFLQNYPQCLQMPCSECGKSLRDFMPPTRFVNLNPLKYAHPDCHQPDR